MSPAATMDNSMPSSSSSLFNIPQLVEDGSNWVTYKHRMTIALGTHCNVPHKPDLRTTNYAPEFPPKCRLPSPLSAVTTTAAVLKVATTFTVSTAAVHRYRHLYRYC
jgi:hypothetical protein